MILKEFSTYLQSIEINKPVVEILSEWLKEKLEVKKPSNNPERIINTELCLFKNKRGKFIIVSKSPSGENLLEALYNFALSYQQVLFARWTHETKASDF